jgi:hypothetical protein
MMSGLLAEGIFQAYSSWKFLRNHISETGQLIHVATFLLVNFPLLVV